LKTGKGQKERAVEGLGPARQAETRPVQDATKEAGRNSTGTPVAGPMKQVGSQVADRFI
jgi:hypothetical protein